MRFEEDLNREAGPPYLGSGLTAGLGLSSHGSLELKGQLDVFDLHPLHLDPPVICGVVQSRLKEDREISVQDVFKMFSRDF